MDEKGMGGVRWMRKGMGGVKMDEEGYRRCQDG